MKKKAEPYPFEVRFARIVATLACTSQAFYARVGKYLEADAFPDEQCKLAVRTAKLVAGEAGRGPDSALIIIQRLRRQMHEGTVTQDQIEAVNDMFDEVEDVGVPDTELVLAEVVPVLKRRLERDALERGFASYHKRGDMSAVSEALAEARRIGEVDTDLGTVLGQGSFEAMERLKQVQRLPTGVLELDDVLRGGPMRGTESMFLAGSGTGKSMGLIQVAVHAALVGHHVAFATMELPEPIILARMKACMTGIPIDAILDDPDKCGVKPALAKLIQGRPFGRIVVKYFPAGATTVGDLTSWAGDVAKEHPISLLVADYFDKCGVAPHHKNKSKYDQGELVYEEGRLWAQENGLWLWTASQAKRKADKKTQRVVQDDVADSINKIRVADLVVSLSSSEDGLIKWYIAKNRLGIAEIEVGPMPHDFACARIAPVDDTQWV